MAQPSAAARFQSDPAAAAQVLEALCLSKEGVSRDDHQSVLRLTARLSPW